MISARASCPRGGWAGRLACGDDVIKGTIEKRQLDFILAFSAKNGNN
jgi:hypothetical protein